MLDTVVLGIVLVASLEVVQPVIGLIFRFHELLPGYNFVFLDFLLCFLVGLQLQILEVTKLI